MPLAPEAAVEDARHSAPPIYPLSSLQIVMNVSKEEIKQINLSSLLLKRRLNLMQMHIIVVYCSSYGRVSTYLVHKLEKNMQKLRRCTKTIHAVFGFMK